MIRTPWQQSKRFVKTPRLRTVLSFQTQMPLARHEGQIAAIMQQLWQRNHTIIKITFVPWLALVRWRSANVLSKLAQTCDMVVGASHKHCTRW